MGNYEGFYERLSEFEELEGKSIQEWLKEWKRGDSPTVTKQEEKELKQIHLEEEARDSSIEFKADVEPEDLDYSEGFENGETVVKHSKGETPLEEISGVFEHPNGAIYVQGKNGHVLGTI
jgi:hypothetical protein